MIHSDDNSPPRPAPAFNEKLEYASSGSAEGALAEIPGKLSGVVDFDSLGLEGMPNSKRLTLWFRSGAKHIFYVRVVRRAGRHIVEMGGMNPGEVLRGIAVCRDHLDRWFGISARDIKAYEGRLDTTGGQPNLASRTEIEQKKE